MTHEKLRPRRIDTHTHPNISKMLSFDADAITRMVRMARRLGLHGLALTEHLHCGAYWDVYDFLCRRYPIRRGVFRAGKVSLIPGGEINIREGAHVVVLGEVNEIRRLDLSFPAPLSRGYEPTLKEMLDVSERFDVVRIGAHMFRAQKELGKFPDDDLRRLDALEVNGKDFAKDAVLLERAADLGLPIVAGSDAHHWLQLGVRHTVVEVEKMGVFEILRAIRLGRTSYDTTPLTSVRVKTAKTIKTWLKRLSAPRAEAPLAVSP
ncbi:MAG: PHP-associated domain-containing protein [Acidobacteriota bacterium]